MSNSLKPGFIPEGWKRGSVLTIWSAPPGRRGAVLQDVGLFVEDIPSPIVAVEFNYEDRQEVDEWIKWWGQGDVK